MGALFLSCIVLAPLSPIFTIFTKRPPPSLVDYLSYDLMIPDVSSSYMESRHCELAQHGYSRDHRADRLQIVYGLLCDRDGRPIAIEVFAGDPGDPATLSVQVEKLKRRFGLKH